MTLHSRRDFCKTTSRAALALVASQAAVLRAAPFGLPVGLQLYSVRQDLAKNYQDTLDQVASLGYQEVEAAGFYDHSPAEVRKALNDAGLQCPSAHYSYGPMTTQLDQIITFCGELGLKYIVCSTPGFKDPERVKNLPRAQMGSAYTADDWKFNAEQFNRMGEKIKAAGMNFAYHNHTVEFHPDSDGAIPFDTLVRLTDPAKVSFEMDCGWVLIGGGNPADYLKKYPNRISMLHVKDFKADKPLTTGKPPEPTELGQGVMDYHPIFQAASKANIKHCFVEQEGYDMPQNESLKIDADYMKKLSA